MSSKDFSKASPSRYVSIERTAYDSMKAKLELSRQEYRELHESFDYIKEQLAAKDAEIEGLKRGVS